MQMNADIVPTKSFVFAFDSQNFCMPLNHLNSLTWRQPWVDSKIHFPFYSCFALVMT